MFRTTCPTCSTRTSATSPSGNCCSTSRGCSAGINFYCDAIDTASYDGPLYRGKQAGGCTVRIARKTWANPGFRFRPGLIADHPTDSCTLPVCDGLWLNPRFRNECYSHENSQFPPAQPHLPLQRRGLRAAATGRGSPHRREARQLPDARVLPPYGPAPHHLPAPCSEASTGKTSSPRPSTPSCAKRSCKATFTTRRQPSRAACRATPVCSPAQPRWPASTRCCSTEASWTVAATSAARPCACSPPRPHATADAGWASTSPTPHAPPSAPAPPVPRAASTATRASQAPAPGPTPTTA